MQAFQPLRAVVDTSVTLKAQPDQHCAKGGHAIKGSQSPAKLSSAQSLVGPHPPQADLEYSPAALVKNTGMRGRKTGQSMSMKHLDALVWPPA